MMIKKGLFSAILFLATIGVVDTFIRIVTFSVDKVANFLHNFLTL